MNKKIDRCPCTLSSGYDTYSSLGLKRVFGAKKVSHVLPYLPPEKDVLTNDVFLENRKRISVSGVQEKLSLVLDGQKLRLTKEGEGGQFILKPFPRDLKLVKQAPANEHLTMQIAAQVYGIKTAANALIFFQDGTAAYITKRFDLKKDGSKWGCEDFASLAGKTSVNAGANYKYTYSYEAMGELLKKYVLAWPIELEKLFQLLLFNYLFSNGDAHLKNFSLLETAQGDYVLSPAYDLLNTRLHVDDTDFALSKGLFEEQEIEGTTAASTDFKVLANKWGMRDRRVSKLLKPFVEKQAEVEELIERSFLSDKAKRAYLLHYQTRRNRLAAGF